MSINHFRDVLFRPRKAKKILEVVKKNTDKKINKPYSCNINKKISLPFNNCNYKGIRYR